MRTVLGGLLLLASIARAAEAPPPPDFIPLSELEAARLDTIRLQVQIVNTALTSLRDRAAKAQNIDLSKYDFAFDRGGFVLKGSGAPSSQPLGPGPTPEPPPQP